MRALALLCGLAACGRIGFDPTDDTLVASHTSVIVAGEFSCALAEGRVACWGRNDEGQLGRGTLTPDTTIAWIPGLDRIEQIVTAADTMFAIDATGALWSWGHGGEKILGLDTTTPRPVPDRTPVFTDLIDLSAGTGACARHATGAISCWGDADAGQLAIGSAPDNSFPVTSLVANVDQLSIGADHGCAVTRGQLSCWGCDQADQLGVDRATMVDTCVDIKSNMVPCALAPIAVPDLSVRFVSAGRAHTCAILSDDRVHCWGDNSFGQLGDGTTTPSVAPVAATGLGAAAVVSTGKEHTCAVLVDGTAWCWGEGSSSGQLGDDMFADSLEPVRVSVPGALRSIDLEQSADHTCAVDVDDQIWCWGSNDYGQLGSMAGTNSATPLLVTLPP